MEGLVHQIVKNVSEDLAEEGQNSSVQYFCNGEQNWTLIGSNFNHQIVEVVHYSTNRLKLDSHGDEAGTC